MEVERGERQQRAEVRRQRARKRGAAEHQRRELIQRPDLRPHCRVAVHAGVAADVEVRELGEGEREGCYFVVSV